MPKRLKARSRAKGTRNGVQRVKRLTRIQDLPGTVGEFVQASSSSWFKLCPIFIRASGTEFTWNRRRAAWTEKTDSLQKAKFTVKQSPVFELGLTLDHNMSLPPLKCDWLSETVILSLDEGDLKLHPEALEDALTRGIALELPRKAFYGILNSK